MVNRLLVLIGIFIGLPGCGGISAGGISPEQRQANLKKIGEAFYAFHDKYFQYPAADGHEENDPKNSRLGLSWRVHLLPFLGKDELFRKFNLDEPWDGPTNSKLIAEMPEVFRSAGAAKPGETCFHVLLGPLGKQRFIFVDPAIPPPAPADKPGNISVEPPVRHYSSKVATIRDGTSNTILAVEAGPSTAAPWTRPGGLVVDLANPKAALAAKNDEVLVLIADGQVRNISLKKISDGQLLALLTRDNGQDEEAIQK